MPLKMVKTKQRNPKVLSMIAYRFPLPVRKVLVYPIGGKYPICPRCDVPIEREYMAFCDRCGQRLNWSIFDFAVVVHAPRR